MCTALLFRIRRIYNIMASNSCTSLFAPGHLEKVSLVRSVAEWAPAWGNLEGSVLRYGILGLDCEWLTPKAKAALPPPETPSRALLRDRVALLQLATPDGLVVVVQLIHLDSRLPKGLKIVLEDPSVLKSGVNIARDCDLLLQHWGILVMNYVDLRWLYVDYLKGRAGVGEDEMGEQAGASNPNQSRDHVGIQQRAQANGIKLLSKELLDVEVLKDMDTIHSDWAARQLTAQQVDYAATDALVSAQIFCKLVHDLTQCSNAERLIEESTNDDLCESLRRSARKIAEPFLCREFKMKKNPLASGKKKKRRPTPAPLGPSSSNSVISSDSPSPSDAQSMPPKSQAELDRIESKFRQCFLRNSPLYHNIELLAPDGQLLALIGPSKAVWYLQKGLCELVSKDHWRLAKKDDGNLALEPIPVEPSELVSYPSGVPNRNQTPTFSNSSENVPLHPPPTIRLFKEPKGRPVGTDFYYVEVKENRCVVCGREDGYCRKNIVPHQYRRLLPDVMKEHRSHDVVLLCCACHYRACKADEVLKHKLAVICEAPLSSQKYQDSDDCRKIRSAARALLAPHSDNIPPARREELEGIIRASLGHPASEPLSPEVLARALEDCQPQLDQGFESHAEKVVKIMATKDGGLVAFERMWRQHFLDCMKPGHMPKKWTLDHNKERYREWDENGQKDNGHEIES